MSTGLFSMGGNMQDCKVNVLGTEYQIRFDDYNSPELKDKGRFGYTFFDEHLIVCVNLDTHEEWKKESEEARSNRTKNILRHELTHAFLYESGMDSNSNESVAWAMNEEMIDWFAIQSPKIFDVFNKLNLL